MTLQIVFGDITKMETDAIVNAANRTLLGGSGVDGCIHRAAGPDLLEECRRLQGCATGQAKITNGYKLPCKYVIHTVGPVWHGCSQDAQDLYNCYHNSLELAREFQCQSIAFPLISAGIYGYPKKEALAIATKASRDFLADHDMEITLVLWKKDDLQPDSGLIKDITAYLNANTPVTGRSFWGGAETTEQSRPDRFMCDISVEALNRRLVQLDESFSQMLLRKIDETGITDVECYRRANVDRKLFSKIRSDIHYKPSKATAVAFAMALHLDIDETEDLLRKAGYALSPSSKFDLIIEFLICQKKYDVDEANVILLQYDQCTLGSRS